jgi:Protein of unknown function (DUF2793)
MSELSSTSRWQLPLLAVGQMQKDVTHNEALARIDALLCPLVESVPQNGPPSAPLAGQCWLIGPAPTGAWTGRPHQLACWTSGGWRCAEPRVGMTARLVDGRLAQFGGSQWILPPTVAAPIGGAIVDSEARTSIAAVIVALQEQGLLAT